MKNTSRPKDTDLLGALPALRRAAHNALQLAIQTGTPCYVIRAGKIVDIAAKRPTVKCRRSRAQRPAHHDHKVVLVKSSGENSRSGGKKKRAGA
ncbi:MAG: hypothetical protein M0Z50_16955 [Planctomycetia bacterium]|nr:hypothetical protein [Planctomycetia bacterium]